MKPNETVAKGNGEMRAAIARPICPEVRRLGEAQCQWARKRRKEKKAVPGSTLSYQLIREAQTCYCLDRPARLPTLA
jgi:hypothetical protein